MNEYKLRNQILGNYEDEETKYKPTYSYPDDYRAKSLTEQIEILANVLRIDDISGELFDLARTLQKIQLPVSLDGYSADGWMASFAWWMKWDNYQNAVEEVLQLISDSRKLKFYQDNLDEKHLRQTERTSQFEQDIWRNQGENFFFFHPFQSGLWHCGRSVRRSREVFVENEFGLGVFAVGSMLLTHSEREQEWEQIHISCSGDDHSPGSERDFNSVFEFSFDARSLLLLPHWNHCFDEQFGSASGFALNI